MIESIGYTQDGLVWVRLVMEVNKERQSGILTLDPVLARKVSTDLATAADKADLSVAKGVLQ